MILSQFLGTVRTILIDYEAVVEGDTDGEEYSVFEVAGKVIYERVVIVADTRSLEEVIEVIGYDYSWEIPETSQHIAKYLKTNPTFGLHDALQSAIEGAREQDLIYIAEFLSSLSPLHVDEVMYSLGILQHMLGVAISLGQCFLSQYNLSVVRQMNGQSRVVT